MESTLIAYGLVTELEIVTTGNARLVGGLDRVIEAGRRARHQGDDRALFVDEGADLRNLPAGVAIRVREFEVADFARRLVNVDETPELVG